MTMIILVFLFSSLHMDLPLLQKWQGLQWYFNVLFPAHTADLNKSDKNYNVVLVFFTAKELAKLKLFQNEGMYWNMFQNEGIYWKLFQNERMYWKLFKMKKCIGNCFKMKECFRNPVKMKECIGNCSKMKECIGNYSKITDAHWKYKCERDF